MATSYNLLPASSAAESPDVIVSDPIKALSYYVGRNDITTATYAVNQDFIGRIRLQGTLFEHPAEEDWLDIPESVYNSIVDPTTGVFSDPMTVFDSGNWLNIDGVAASAPMQNGWAASQITFDMPTSKMTVTLNDTGTGLVSGKYISAALRGYGRYEVIIQASNVPGTVTEVSVGDIKIQILGDDPTKMHVRYLTTADTVPSVVNLGFDASASQHSYVIDWQPGHILWYVDSLLVYTENGSNGPLPSNPCKIGISLWAATGLAPWCTNFNPASIPAALIVDNASYSPYIRPFVKVFSFKGNFVWIRAILDSYTKGSISYVRIAY